MKIWNYGLLCLILYYVKQLKHTTMKATFMVTGSDCNIGGITTSGKEVVMFYNCTEQDALRECQEEDIDPYSVLFFQERALFGGKAYPYARPLIKRSGIQMYGGNDISVEGLGFENADKNPNILKIHDRYESQEVYDTLSR